MLFWTQPLQGNSKMAIFASRSPATYASTPSGLSALRTAVSSPSTQSTPSTFTSSRPGSPSCDACDKQEAAIGWE